MAGPLIAASGRAWHGEDELALAPTGRRVLERLMRHPGEVVSREALFAELAGENGLRRQSTWIAS